MIIDDATIYNEGVGIGHDCEEKIRQIMTTLKTISPSSKLSMRFLKNGAQYEALIWGNADDMPIGVYNRGPSLAHVLDIVYNKIKRQCLKAWKSNGGYRSHQADLSDSRLAIAG